MPHLELSGCGINQNPKGNLFQFPTHCPQDLHLLLELCLKFLLPVDLLKQCITATHPELK